MICFVILHYIVKEETIKCVKSIKDKVIGDKKIIIVDNFSPNNSGKELKKIYKDDNEVDVILNDINSGYASGNNKGYIYAKKNFNPEYIVILNNDVEIDSNEFTSKLYESYEKQKFHILGPDVYSTTYKLHQNPKRLHPYSYSEIKRLNEKFEKNQNLTKELKLKCIIKKYNFVLNYLYKYRRSKLNIDISKIQFDIILHGSCLILSKDFIHLYDKVFQEGGFFYYEMEMLNYICKRDGLISKYDPALKVLHHQNISTNAAFNKVIDKTLFSNKCNYESTCVFLKLMENESIDKDNI